MKLNNVIKALNNYLLTNNINNPIALVGSTLKNSNYNDIDFLMIVDNIVGTKNQFVIIIA